MIQLYRGPFQSPRVAIYGGGWIGARGGMGQAVTTTVGQLLSAPSLNCALITPEGRVRNEIDRHRPTSIGPRLRRRFIRETQEHTNLPMIQWLTGKYDVYHYIGLGLRPVVPRERLVISTYDLGGERWPDEAPYPAWAASTLRGAARVTTISEFSKNELCAYYNLPPEQVDVIYLGYDERQFNPEPAASDAAYVKTAIGHGVERYVLCAGGNTKRKNVERLIQAFARCRSTTNSLEHLVVTGVNPLSPKGAEYHRLSHELGVDAHVILPGYLDDEMMPALYRSAQAVAVPSLYEGFGFPVLQAMACGTPVLASKASSLPEVAGDAALLVDATSVDELAGGLARIVNDEGLRAELRRRGLDRAAAFTWERCISETIAVYEDVAARAATSGHKRAGVRSRAL